MKTEAISVRESGRIQDIKGSIVKIKGLSNCLMGQLVNFEDNTRGLVMGFNRKVVLVLLLGLSQKIKAGGRVYTEAKPFEIPAGDNFLGRIVNALAEPVDGKQPIKADSSSCVFREAAAVLDRAPVAEMFLTGIRAIDSSIPIGKGQRELIIGDRMTGKTTIAVDAILSQKERDVISIYCCIGRDYASFEKVVNVFKEAGVLDKMIIVCALASSPLGEKYLAPYTAATLGEHFMYSGRDICVVFDDLTKHAWAYRELSLLLERAPGREAYPGDVFYLHAQLMERAGKLAPELGSGTMTFFPIADTLQGDIAGFIPTNLISMTDGQIYLNSTLFGEGFKPAIDLGLSVSRVGSRVQPVLMKEFTKDLGLNYIQYRELLKSTKLRAGVSEELSARLRHGEKIEQVLTQDKNSPSSLAEQLLLFYALKEGVLDVLSFERCADFKKNILNFAQRCFPDLVKKLNLGKELSNPSRQALKVCLVKFFKEQESGRAS